MDADTGEPPPDAAALSSTVESRSDVPKPRRPVPRGREQSHRPRSVYDDLVAIGAETFTKEELEEALRAIASTISKCEKAQPKLRKGTSQHTLLARRIKALRIASALIQRELDPCSTYP